MKPRYTSALYCLRRRNLHLTLPIGDIHPCEDLRGCRQHPDNLLHAPRLRTLSSIQSRTFRQIRASNKRGLYMRHFLKVCALLLRAATVLLAHAIGMDFSEPSSALATKISRAWDNPSPPPSPPFPPHNPEDLLELDTHQAVDLPPFEAGTSESDVAAMLDVQQGATEESLSRELSVATLPQSDLINFDPPTYPNNAPRPPLVTHSITSSLTDFVQAPLDTYEHSSTVDELLAISPQRQMTPPPLPSTEVPVVDVRKMLSADNTYAQKATPLEEQVDIQIQQLAPVTISSTPSTSPIPPQPLINLAPVLESEESGTPLRRSSRQRRSVSPLVLPLVNQHSPSATFGSQDIPALQVSPNEPLLLSPRSGPARRKSAKGKERELSSLPTGVTEAEAMHGQVSGTTEVPPTPSERPEEHTRFRLRSLSPTSTGVLEQLLPSKLSSAMHEPQHNPFIPQPVFAAPPRASNISSANTASQKTPLEPPRTPARRVPISQAVKEGSLPTHSAFQILSPRKPDLNATNTGSFGSPVFRRVALDDPTRSPAKRIPVVEALPSATKPRPPANADLFAPNPPQYEERSQSEEPLPSVATKSGRSASVEPVQSVLSVKKSGLGRIPSAVLSTPTNLPYPITRTPNRTISAIPEVDETEVQTSGISSSPTRPTAVRPLPARIESRIPRIGAKPYARTTVKASTARTNSTDATAVDSATQATKSHDEVAVPKVCTNFLLRGSILTEFFILGSCGSQSHRETSNPSSQQRTCRSWAKVSSAAISSHRDRTRSCAFHYLEAQT